MLELYFTLLAIFPLEKKSCFFLRLQIVFKTKNSVRNTTRVSNSLDLDQARRFVAPNLGPNRLQKLSAGVTRR